MYQYSHPINTHMQQECIQYIHIICISSINLGTHDTYDQYMYKPTLNPHTTHVYACSFSAHTYTPHLAPVHTLYICTYVTIFPAPCCPAESCWGCWGQDGAVWLVSPWSPCASSPEPRGAK